MDALPLSLTREQLSLMHDGICQALAELQKQQQSGQFGSDQEQTLLTYGSLEYEKAQERVQAIVNQVKSNLEGWHGDSEAQSLPLSLDSYQTKILRSTLERHLQQGSAQDQQQTLKNLLEQLPEDSPQEHAD